MIYLYATLIFLFKPAHFSPDNHQSHENNSRNVQFDYLFENLWNNMEEDDHTYFTNHDHSFISQAITTDTDHQIILNQFDGYQNMDFNPISDELSVENHLSNSDKIIDHCQPYNAPIEASRQLYDSQPINYHFSSNQHHIFEEQSNQPHNSRVNDHHKYGVQTICPIQSTVDYTMNTDPTSGQEWINSLMDFYPNSEIISNDNLDPIKELNFAKFLDSFCQQSDDVEIPLTSHLQQDKQNNILHPSKITNSSFVRANRIGHEKEQELFEKYLELKSGHQRLTDLEICRILQITTKQLYRIKKAHGVLKQNQNKAKSRNNYLYEEKKQKMQKYMEIKHDNPTLSDKIIAEILGITTRNICDWKISLGLEKRERMRSRRHCIDYNFLLQQYLQFKRNNPGIQDKQIANEFKVHPTILCRMKNKSGGTKKYSRTVEAKCQFLDDYVKIRKQNPGISERNVAKILGISIETLYSRKREFGLPKRQNHYSEAERSNFIQIYKEHKGKNPSITDTEIANILGIKRHNLRQWKIKGL